MTTLGQVLLAFASVAALGSILALVWGHLMGKKEGGGLTNAGYWSTFAIFASTTLAVVILVVAFFRKDFTFLYVAQNHSTDVSSLAWLFNLSGLWAGREGSLLLWAWMLSGFAAFVAARRLRYADALSNIGIAVTNFVQLFFLVALFIETNNPFKAAIVAADGTVSTVAGQVVGNVNSMAMNPLLQHWAMILHPPTLFLGYAGLTIPFAFALAAVFLRDDSKRWVELVDRLTVFSWLSLGIGIGLGAIWAYVVLGWGGYWAWDPVENASLLPWLTGVALLHSFTVYRRRGAFKAWTVMLTAITFVLVLLGTFITRSGVIQSVHAFEKDPISLWWFLSMMILSLVVPAFALASRRPKQFSGGDGFDSLFSKEASYYFNNAFMIFAAFLVAALTLSPAVGGPTFKAATYDVLARPIGILYALIMAVCPILSWGKTEPKTFWSRAKWPLGGAAILGAGLIAVWYTVLLPNYQFTTKGLPALYGVQPMIDHVEAVIGLLVAALCVALPIYLFIDGARKRSAAKGTGFFPALGGIVFKARTQSGGYITHLGIGVILIGLIGSAIYVSDRQITVPDKPGGKASAGAYTFVFQGVDPATGKPAPNGDVETKIILDVQKDGQPLGQMRPGQIQYAVQQQTRLEAAVLSNVVRDVFVAIQGSDTSGWSLDVKVNPLISWVWAGFGLLVIGSGIAMWPRREREPVPVPAPATKSGKPGGSRKPVKKKSR